MYTQAHTHRPRRHRRSLRATRRRRGPWRWRRRRPWLRRSTSLRTTHMYASVVRPAQPQTDDQTCRHVRPTDGRSPLRLQSLRLCFRLGLRLCFRLRVGDGGSAKPAEHLEELLLRDPCACKVARSTRPQTPRPTRIPSLAARPPSRATASLARASSSFLRRGKASPRTGLAAVRLGWARRYSEPGLCATRSAVQRRHDRGPSRSDPQLAATCVTPFLIKHRTEPRDLEQGTFYR